MSSKTGQEGRKYGIDENYVRNGAAGVTEDDLGRIMSDPGKLDKSALSNVLAKRWEDIRTLFNLASDYWNGTYRDVSWTTIATIVFSLLYIINPFDVIPDVIPVVGQLDDLAVLCICLAAVGSEVDRYREWKAEKNQTINI
jgi:uncharacterized membrane protein YkvA (DUF1232 family)